MCPPKAIEHHVVPSIAFETVAFSNHCLMAVKWWSIDTWTNRSVPRVINYAIEHCLGRLIVSWNDIWKKPKAIFHGYLSYTLKNSLNHQQSISSCIFLWSTSKPSPFSSMLKVHSFLTFKQFVIIFELIDCLFRVFNWKVAVESGNQSIFKRYILSFHRSIGVIWRSIM